MLAMLIIMAMLASPMLPTPMVTTERGRLSPRLMLTTDMLTIENTMAGEMLGPCLMGLKLMLMISFPMVLEFMAMLDIMAMPAFPMLTTMETTTTMDMPMLASFFILESDRVGIDS